MNPEDQKHRYCRQFVVTNHRGPTTGLSKSKTRILFDMIVCNHSLGKLTNLCYYTTKIKIECVSDTCT